jgi:uncharacterized protein
LNVIGHGAIETVPDHVSIRLGVTSKGPSPTTVLDQNSAAARRVIDFAKRFGIGDQDIRTDSIDLTQVIKTVREQNGSTRQEPDGYSARNAVQVKLKDLSRFGIFLRQVLDQGANNINGVQFGLSHPENTADEARAMAVEDALRQARILADAAKVKLGSIQQIAYPPRIQTADGSAADLPVFRKIAQVPLEVGTIRIDAQVEIIWTIE